MRANRTKLGLKEARQQHYGAVCAGRQSNQAGIESQYDGTSEAVGAIERQSNQAGIERCLSPPDHQLAERGANRTKLGLKGEHILPRLGDGVPRQSNQAGIERRLPAPPPEVVEGRANRTKLGLKVAEKLVGKNKGRCANRTKLGLKVSARASSSSRE